MSYDNWKQAQSSAEQDLLAPNDEQGGCKDCGADPHTPCLPECGCAFCRRHEAEQDGDEPPKEAA